MVMCYDTLRPYTWDDVPTIEMTAFSEPGTNRCSLCSGLMNVSGTGIWKSGM